MSFALRQADTPFFNACSYQERAFYEDWQRESGLSTYEMCRILEAQRDERDRQAYEDYLEECRDMMRQQAEAEAEAEAEAAEPVYSLDDEEAWAADRLVWKSFYDQIRTGLNALLETHLDETLAVALTAEQLAHYHETLDAAGLEDMVAQFLADEEAHAVLCELFEAHKSGTEFDVDEKVAGLYQQFAREFVEKLALGYA
jgi:hypothetical protein